MKKLLLSLGALATVVAPVAAVVACSSDDDKKPVTPRTPGEFQLTSTKSVSQLNAIKNTDLTNKSIAELNSIFGIKETGTHAITNAGTNIWNAETSTLTVTKTVANKIMKFNFVITGVEDAKKPLIHLNGADRDGLGVISNVVDFLENHVSDHFDATGASKNVVSQAQFDEMKKQLKAQGGEFIDGGEAAFEAAVVGTNFDDVAKLDTGKYYAVVKVTSSLDAPATTPATDPKTITELETKYGIKLTEAKDGFLTLEGTTTITGVKFDTTNSILTFTRTTGTGATAVDVTSSLFVIFA